MFINFDIVEFCIITRWSGRSAPPHGPTDYHPLSVRRFAPSIKRLKRIVAPASKLASTPTAYPQAVK